jgi:cobalt-zinc-cadmium efflux system membrane fusion protein
MVGVRWVGVVGALCALSVSWACGRADAPAASAPSGPRQQEQSVVTLPPDSPQLKQIRVDPVQLADMPTDELVAPARVIPNPNRISRLLPQVQGRVMRVMAQLGDTVEQGQPLVELDSPDADAAISTFLQAQAGERQAQATLAKAKADLARATDLYDYKAIAEKDLLGAKNDFAQATEGVETARAALEQARRKLELLGLTPKGSRQPVFVRAPLSGKIIEVNVAPGEYRGAVSSHSDTTTAPLMTIADLSTVWVSAEVPEPSVRLIHVGEPVSISFVSFPDESFTGKVTRIGDVLDPQTRTLKVYIVLPNPQGRLRPEMFGSLKLLGPTRAVPVVPPTAIIQEYGQALVFVERKPGQFDRRQISTGVRVGSAVAVLSGVQAGDRVITDGAVLLKGQ